MATITSPRPTSPHQPQTPSIAGTPTSSVRPSIDLPAQPSANPTTTRRNRTALRDYYNLKSRGAPTTSHPNTHSRTNSLTSTLSEPDHSTTLSNLDDPSFNADAYITQLLSTSTLRDILKTESTLVSEIRTLDGERKALVYDNYSKLIKAVGTIADLQRGMALEGQGQGFNVLGVKKEAKGLKDVEELTGRTDRLVGFVEGLQGQEGQREMVREKRRRKELERKKDVVRWVVQAPERLKELIEDGKEDEAKREWDRVQQVISKWQGVKGVEQVRKRCEELFKDDEKQHTEQELQSLAD